MTSLHTAPLPRSFFGIDPGPSRKMFFGMGPDIQWLAFNQFVSRPQPERIGSTVRCGCVRVDSRALTTRRRFIIPDPLCNPPLIAGHREAERRAPDHHLAPPAARRLLRPSPSGKGGTNAF